MNNFGTQFPGEPSAEIKEPGEGNFVFEAKDKNEPLSRVESIVTDQNEEQEEVEVSINQDSNSATKENKKKPLLSEFQELRVREFVGKNDSEGLFTYLKGLGIPATTQSQVASRFMKDLEDSIKRISWTKERLSYMTGILFNTLLRTDDSNVTSVDNLILNYLIFSEKFKEKEDNKALRFGQFSYVMRTVFSGVSKVDDIYSRIQNHKTFGGIIDKLEIEGFNEEIDHISEAIKARQREALEKKKKADEALDEVTDTEKKEKGSVWNVGYSEPKEYVFPNYTFQTGEKKGSNKSVGRSSWEPLFEAYADTVNKKMEDRISAKIGLSEEEKQKRIKEQRIELLYEKFEFPVGLRTNEKGEKVPIIYILDFIDMNRWRGIEVKGPLTPKAAEKIKSFQKYYVDGDFSDLPEDEKIIMMSYVQNKMDEVRDYCREHEYPVFDHFSSLEVLGMYKWDKDLNNFNRYEEAGHMKELSVRQRQQLQKGFIKLVEDRIKDGKTPDIRPEYYVESDKLPELIKINNKKAKEQKVPYLVQENFSTKPYNVKTITEEVKVYLEKNRRGDPGLLPELDRIADKNVLDTLPFSSREKLIYESIGYSSAGFQNFVSNFYEHILTQLENHKQGDVDIQLIKERKTALSIDVGIFDYRCESIKKSVERIIEALEVFSGYLVVDAKKFSKNKHLEPKKDYRFLQSIILNLKKVIDNLKSNKIMIDHEVLLSDERIGKLQSLSLAYGAVLLGETGKLYWKRRGHVSGRFKNNLAVLDFGRLIDKCKKDLENYNKRTNLEMNITEFEDTLISLSVLEEGLADRHDEIGTLLSFSIARQPFPPETSLVPILRRKFNSIEQTVKFFESKSKDKYTREEYLDFFKKLLNFYDHMAEIIKKNDKTILKFFIEKRDLIIFVASSLLLEELGEKKYYALINRFKENSKKY